MHRGNVVTMWPLDDQRAADEPGGATEPAESEAALVQRAMASASPAVTATVAVSPREASSYGEAYRMAKGALDIAVRAGRTDTVVRLDDLGVIGLLLQLDDSARLAAFADRTLGPLLAYDQAHHTELVATLRAYFAAKLDRNVTAAALHVHPNTVTQRLRRIEALCHVELADPAVAVQFSAAMTVQDVASVWR